MGKSSRAYRSREIKGQRKEVLSAAEAAYGVEDEDKDTRKLALARAAAAPTVPVVNKNKFTEKERAPREEGAMEVDAAGAGRAPPGASNVVADPGEARLRRVLGATPGVAFKKSAHKLKQLGITPVHPNHRAMRKMKKALKRGAAL